MIASADQSWCWCSEGQHTSDAQPARSPWLIKCGRCGTLRTHPRPTTLALVTATTNYLHTEPPPTVIRHRTGWRRIWVLPDLSWGARILEFGAGVGGFADYAAIRGWHVTTVDGVGAAEAWTGDLGTYDAVVGWQVLEHCLDPELVLLNALAATRPGGQIMFSVPNVRSLERWLRGPRWADWQLHWHLWHFTPRTIRRLCASAGCQRVRILHQRIFKGVGPVCSVVLGAVVAAFRISSRMTVVIQT